MPTLMTRLGLNNARCLVRSVTTAVLLGPVAVAARPVQAQEAARTPSPDATFRQYAEGLLARTAYVAEPSGLYRVELWDLLVGPGKRSEPATLPGGAVFEVRAGTGRLELDGRPQDLRPGMTFAVHRGVRFALRNGRTDLGLAIRAIVVRAGPR